jgi:hypothetical protein
MVNGRDVDEEVIIDGEIRRQTIRAFREAKETPIDEDDEDEGIPITEALRLAVTALNDAMQEVVRIQAIHDESIDELERRIDHINRWLVRFMEMVAEEAKERDNAE